MSKKILIADDEPNIVAAIEFLLKQRGYEVHTARDGDEALRVVERVVPDLVLLDVMMPQTSGYEVCQSIRERAEWRHIKIIMLSAKGRDAEVVQGARDGRGPLRHEALLDARADGAGSKALLGSRPAITADAR